MKQKVLVNSVFLFLAALALFGSQIYGQGINYPGNVPSNNGGAGNARTDADNLFTRNNPGAMTEIESEDIPDKKSNWRVMFEAQGVFYRYERKFTPFGFNQTVKSEVAIALPTLSGEITYTAKSKRYAFGVGLSQTFGFESKLKDSETILGSQAQFYDTKVASNDVAFAGAFRVHKKLSIGGSFIVGRAFLLQIAPVPQLAAIGIIKQNRLDVSRIGGVGASFSVHFRPTEKVSFGFNYKTARKYDLQGTLDTVFTLVTPTGLQFAPIQLNIKVPFKFPSIIESGVNIKPNERFFIDFDYRFYRYSKALDTISVLDKQSGTILATQNLNAKDVHLFLVGGAYNLTEKSKILYGAGLTTNALNDVSFNPGLNNSGGISVSGGYARRISGVWLNFGATGIFALNRTINAAPQVFFPGSYKSRGIIFGIGVRR
ncbi:MAG: outer membrane protein transport protein [Pyrinomonadaceae bacterium]|nr:outer membrane protein transport protein [Pyrinomonadaceae bacterium]